MEIAELRSNNCQLSILRDNPLMRILVTGSLGQLGRAFRPVLAGHELFEGDLPEFDITDRPGLLAIFEMFRPELVIHCAAYTDVDGCARNPELAWRVNTFGSQNVALACRQVGADMVHISTNEVFSGDDPAGYNEWSPLKPMNPYACSKAAAELYVRQILPNHYIVRIAWLFAAGGRNFVHTILRHAREKGQIRVVADEIGNPTYANDAVEAVGRLITTGQYGTYHFTNQGACSRWQFANEILRMSNLPHVVNTPILSRDYQRASTPPRFAVLHNTAGAALGLTLRPWQTALEHFLQTL